MQINYWHWLAIAAIFLIIELTSGGTLVFFCLSIASISASLLAWLLLSWEYQLLAFAIVAAGCVVLLKKGVFRALNSKVNDLNLNRRIESYIGRKAILIEPIVAGSGKIKLNDTLWQVQGPDLPAGTIVLIKSVANGYLLVEPVVITDSNIT